MGARKSLFIVFTTLFVVCLTGCGGGGGGGDSDTGEDTKAPTVTSTVPAHMATDVARDVVIAATFSEAVEQATITKDSFLLKDINGNFVDGTTTYDPPSKTATFSSNAVLSGTSGYTVILTNFITDLAGNKLQEYSWRFTTGESFDMTPPTVINNYPLDGSVEVYLNSIIVATFNEPIDPATRIPQNFILQDSGDNVISGDLSTIGTSVLFTPTDNMIEEEPYTFTVSNQVTDMAGNGLDGNQLNGDYLWSFTTGTELDLVGPTVLAVFPEDGAVDVPVDSELKVTFDEAIVPFNFGTIDGWPVRVEFSPTYNTVYMQPTAGLSPNTLYNTTIFVSDMAQNEMFDTFSWSFTTSP